MVYTAFRVPIQPLEYLGVLNSLEKAITALNSAFGVSVALLFPVFYLESWLFQTVYLKRTKEEL
ncbi:MAG: hypothetical protein ACTTG8_04995 [Catonella sp.]